MVGLGEWRGPAPTCHIWHAATAYLQRATWHQDVACPTSPLQPHCYCLLGAWESACPVRL